MKLTDSKTCVWICKDKILLSYTAGQVIPSLSRLGGLLPGLGSQVIVICKSKQLDLVSRTWIDKLYIYYSLYKDNWKVK